MVFIGGAEPEVIKNAIRVPETYPSDEDKPPFNPKEVVRIRNNAKFDEFYEIYGEPLGEGKFGKVYQCRERSSGLELAAKFIKIRKDADKKTVEREVSIMTQMRHPRIAQIYDAFYAGDNNVILLMEIVRGGELFNRVAEESYVLTEKAVAMIVCQICEAIEYIHSQHIIHLDIKPENIMCVSETGNRVKLIDFGLAQYYDGSKDLYYMAGTPEFAAPEVIKYEPLDFRTDMWSVGVITYILLSGYSPFLGDNVAETYVNVERGEWEFTEEFEFVSEPAKDFIRNLLSYDKLQRMYPRECLKHPWIAETRAQATIDCEIPREPPTLIEKPKEEEPTLDPGPHIDTSKLKKYIIRRRFRKLAFAVMCYVDFRKILTDLRRIHSVKGEEFFSSAHIPEDPNESMGSILGKKSRSDEDQVVPTTVESSNKDEVPTNGSDDTDVVVVIPTEEKVIKKKKKQTTTTSSGAAERPKVKKPKKEEIEPLKDEASPPHTDESDSKEKSVQKKRMKKEATSMATSSQEKPAKIVRKSSNGEAKSERIRVSKSPSPAKNVPVIIEVEEAKPKKKSIKPASSDSGVVIERSGHSMDKDKSSFTNEMTMLSPPETAEKKVKKTRKSSSSTNQVANEAKPSKPKEGNVASLIAKDRPKTSSSSGSLVASRLAQISRTESAPLKMPTICIQPATPSTPSSSSNEPTSSKKKVVERAPSPLSIKIPSTSSSSGVTSPNTISSPSTEPIVEETPKRRKKKEDGEATAKKKVWKQEKYTTQEGSESRRSTEVIVVPKNSLPPTVEAEKAALVKKRAQASPLADRIARMENMAKEKEKEQDQRRGKLKVEREPSMKKEPSPAPTSKTIPVVTEKSSTTTKTTTTSVKNKSEEKDCGMVVSTPKSRIEVHDKTEKDVHSIKVNQIEVKEEKSIADETPKKTVKKTVVKKTSTISTQKKTKTEDRSESIDSSVSGMSTKTAKHELDISDKVITNGTTVKDGELKLAHEVKKKVKLDEKQRLEATEKEVAVVSVRDKEVKEKVKKTTLTSIKTDDSNSTSTESTPVKKKTRSRSTKEPTPPIIDYPEYIADDIQIFKEARAKAKRKEEELQQRHVRFADEASNETSLLPQQIHVHRSTKIERSTEEDENKDEKPRARRKSSFFEVTEDEKDKLEQVKEDFSFQSLRQKLERQLYNKNNNEPAEESVGGIEQEAKKEVIVCPSTNSLLKKWKNIEKTNS